MRSGRRERREIALAAALYGASILGTSAAQKQALKAEWNKQPAGSTPQAPVIVLPTANSLFLAPFNVLVRATHSPNPGVTFEFKRKPMVTTKHVPSFWSTQKVSMFNVKTNPPGTTSGQLPISGGGKWRVRARSNFMNAPWSAWSAFTVDAEM